MNTVSAQIKSLTVASMIPFYFSVCIHVIFMMLILFVLPESLSSESRQILKKNAEVARENARLKDAADREWESTPVKAVRAVANERDPLLQGDSAFSRISGSDVNHSRRRKRLVGTARRILRRTFAFLQPLSVFAPRETEDGGKDWNLTKVGAGMFLIGCLMVCTLQVRTTASVLTASCRDYFLRKPNLRCTTMAGHQPR